MATYNAAAASDPAYYITGAGGSVSGAGTPGQTSLQWYTSQTPEQFRGSTDSVLYNALYNRAQNINPAGTDYVIDPIVDAYSGNTAAKFGQPDNPDTMYLDLHPELKTAADKSYNDYMYPGSAGASTALTPIPVNAGGVQSKTVQSTPTTLAGAVKRNSAGGGSSSSTTLTNNKQSQYSGSMGGYSTSMISTGQALVKTLLGS